MSALVKELIGKDFSKAFIDLTVEEFIFSLTLLEPLCTGYRIFPGR